jgi:adenylate cyclase
VPGSIEIHCRLILFGGFRLILNGREIRLASAKERGLLAYLAVEGPEPQPRSHLTSLLWGDRFEEQARLSLRQALSKIRRQSGDRILAADKEVVALRTDALACDVSEFLALAKQDSSASLLSATRLFGEFLRGLEIGEESFAEWQSRTRERLTQIQIDCLQKLGQHELEGGNYRTAIEFLKQAVRLDEFREDIHRLIIAALTADGRRAQALRHAHGLSDRLQRELGVGLGPATANFVTSIRRPDLISEVSSSLSSLKYHSQPVEGFVRDQTYAPPVLTFEEHGRAPAPVRYPSIAVVKLNNISSDPALDHLSKTLVDDVTNRLARFRNLVVIAGHSAFLFSLSSYSAREIGRRLGARYLLGGSLRDAGKCFRVCAELIDTEHERVLWSDRFDIGLNEMIGWQDEITAMVASRLAVQIDLAELRCEYDPHDMRAYGLVKRGQQSILGFTKKANTHARQLFKEALDLAPVFSRAYGGVARTYNLDWRYEWSSSPEASLDAAVDFARSAIKCDPLDARGYAELGYAYLYLKRIDESLAEYRRALALNPNDADIIAEYADALGYAGEPEKAVGEMQRAMRLNPYYPDWYLWYLADAYQTLNRPSDVIATVNRMQNPSEGNRLLAANYAHLGMMDEARAAAAEVMHLHPHFTISSWRHRPPYLDTSLIEPFVEGLRKAGLPE